MASGDTENRSSRGRGWKILLVISLALNLLFIGLIGGAMARFGGPGAYGGSEKTRGPSLGTAVFRALPREDRRAMFRDVAGKRPDRGEGGSEDRDKEAQALLSNLRAEELDADMLVRFAEQQAEKRLTRGLSVVDSWVERVRAMSVTERRAYADRLEEMLNKPGKKRRWGKPDPD
ncbi:MAG: periplasmic heavy metal sensor [Arenibacterium sp.]